MSRALMPRAHVRIAVTDPSGKVVREIEGDVSDGFTQEFLNILWGMFTFPYWQGHGGLEIPDAADTLYTFWAPGNTLASPFLGWCLFNCPGTPNVVYHVNMPGVWLYSTPFSPYTYIGINYGALIYDVTYYPPSPSPALGVTPVASYGGTYQLSVTQMVVNTSGSTKTVTSMALVGALYPFTSGGLSATPIYFGVLYFDLAALGESPITWSPAAGITVTVTIQLPT